MINTPTLSIDFEYNQSSEKHPNLVCCSLMFEYHESTVEEYWLLNDYDEHGRLANRLLELRDANIFIAHAATAESRCFLALGVDPTKFRWIDTFLERRQLTNKCDRFSYGTYFDKQGNKKESSPPSFLAWKNEGVDNRELYNGYADSVGRHLGIDVNLARKDAMRDIILTCDDELIEINRKEIQSYCTSDIVYLNPLANQMFRDLESVTHLNASQILNSALRRGRFAADSSKMESIGIPLDIEKLDHLIDNYDLAKNELISDVVDNHYPFFVRERDSKFKNHINGTWKLKSSQIVKFIEDNGLDKGWPRTEPNSRSPFGSYKTDKDTLSLYNHIPEIAALAECNKQIGQLKWFRPLSESEKKQDGEFKDAVGSDGMLRPYLGLLGTQTGRNAPPAKKFIFAMSSWLRCLIRPPKGEIIIACDWGSQEFAVAAMKSGDVQMVEAYRSNDPYLYFMKMAGAVPEDADPKMCKAPALVWKDVVLPNKNIDIWHLSQDDLDYLGKYYPIEYQRYGEYKEYEKQRNLGKGTVLGLQFGLGVANLAKKLTLDTGEEVTERDAQKLVKQHKSLFKTFWKWVDQQVKKYHKDQHLTLWDGWTLLGDNSNDLSVKNFPVQGESATIMRLAVQKATDAGVQIMCPLHDAIYARCKVEDEKEITAKLHKAMDDAVADVLGDSLQIRIDTDIHGHDDVWIEGKGVKNYERLKQFLESRPESMENRNRTMNKFFNVLRAR